VGKSEGWDRPQREQDEPIGDSTVLFFLQPKEAPYRLWPLFNL
jgi:hypothetical protein